MDYDEVIRAINDLCTFHETGGHEGNGDDATCATVRAAALILMEYGARLMREAGMLKANELFKSTEVFAMLYNLDPADIVKEAVK